MAGTEQDEIEKIMSEIEDLQKEISSEESHSAPSAVEAPMSDTVEEDILQEIQAQVHSADGSDAGAGLEDTLADLKEEKSNGGLLDEVESVSDAEEVSMSKNSSDGTVSLTLSGNMTLKLKYEFEGQDVMISFVDQALRVQMSDGTEFKVPVTRGNAATNVKPFKKAI